MGVALRWALIAIGAAVAVVLAVRELPEEVRAMLLTDPEALAAALRSYGPWAPLVSLGLMLVETVLTPLPFVLIATANGFVFGAWEGALLSFAGAMLGASASFWIARRLGRDWVRRRLGAERWARAEVLGRDVGFQAVLVARLLPLMPSMPVSYAAGLTPISFSTYFWATALGKLPYILAYSFVGDRLELLLPHAPLIGAVVTAALAGWIVWRIARWYRHRRVSSL